MTTAMTTAMKLPHLVTERLCVRLATREDAAAIVEYFIRTREAFRETEPLRAPEFYTKAFWVEQAERSIQDFARGQNVRFFLFDSGGRLIGSVGFNQIVRGPFQACNLGYALDPAEQGKGLMHEALTASIRHVFEDLRLHRVMAGYMPRNTRSAAVLKRLGFRIEGQARDYVRINGQWEDHVLTSLINSAWRDSAGQR